MEGEERAVVFFLCVTVICVASWFGYWQVNRTNVEGRTRRAIAEACQTEPDTDVVECAYEMSRALEGEDPTDDSDG